MKFSAIVAWKRTGLVLKLGVAALALVALAGCTMVQDNVTGVSAKLCLRPSDCVQGCNQTLYAGLASETRTSLANLEACKQLPTASERDACALAEIARYKAAVQALNAAWIDCVNGCHRQGTGTAG
jgi:hypothetical protein